MACSVCGQKYKPAPVIPGMEKIQVQVNPEPVVEPLPLPTDPISYEPPQATPIVSTGPYVITVDKP